MGQRLKGVYHLLDNKVLMYESGKNYVTQEAEIIDGIGSPYWMNGSDRTPMNCARKLSGTGRQPYF